jgi:membrane fusion protein
MTTTHLAPRPLFREEALRARELAWQGRPALSLGLPAAFITCASLALAVAVTALVTFGSYTRRVDLEGAVLPNSGLITIAAPASGWIKTLAVHEGASVSPGAPLYTLDVDIATKGGSTQELVIDALLAERRLLARQIDHEQQAGGQTQQALRQKIDNLQKQLAQLSSQLAMQQGFVQDLTGEYHEFMRLLASRTASLNEADARRQAWMQSESELQQLAGNRLRLEAALVDARFQLATNGIATQDKTDTLKAKIADIDDRLAITEAHRAIVIRAPGPGVVTAVLALPGQMVGSGAPMLTIVPQHASMQADLLAPSNAIGFIRPGERVLLRYSAFPYQKFGQYPGTVVSVSDAALSPEEATQLLAGAPPLADQTGPYYRVIVAPTKPYVTVFGQHQPLPASMEVKAYVLLDRRPLYQWILGPLYGVGRAGRGA